MPSRPPIKFIILHFETFSKRFAALLLDFYFNELPWYLILYMSNFYVKVDSIMVTLLCNQDQNNLDFVNLCIKNSFKMLFLAQNQTKIKCACMIPLFRFATEFINIVPVYFETCFDIIGMVCMNYEHHQCFYTKSIDWGGA